MRNIEVRIHVKLEVKVPIKIFLRNFPLPLPPHKKHHSRKNFDRRNKNGPMQKISTQANHLKIMIHAKKILTHVTHVKI